MTISHPITSADVRAIYDAELAAVRASHAKAPEALPLELLAYRGAMTRIHEQLHQVHAPPPRPPAEILAVRAASDEVVTAVLAGAHDGHVEGLRAKLRDAHAAAAAHTEHQHEAVEKPHNKALWVEVKRLLAEAGITETGAS